MTKFSKVLGMFTALPFLGAALAAVAEDEPDSRAENGAGIVKRYDSKGAGSLSRGELRTAQEAGPRLDTAGDGTPSEADHADRRDTWSDRRGRHRGERRGSHFDRNGDGGITDEERGAEQRELDREIMLQRHDADSDAR